MHYIYTITNLINGKIYVGQSKDVNKRWSDHRGAVKNNRPTQIVHHALIKYGLDNFVFDVIAGCKTQDDVNWTEEYFISQYDSTNSEKGYNLTNGGCVASKTEEWKKKVSDKLMGHAVLPETREKLSIAHSGKILSQETKDKISFFNKDKFVSQETRNKLSEINKGNSNFKGRKHADNSKKKIGDANRGKPSPYKGISTEHKCMTWKIIDGKRVWVKKE